MLGPDVSAGLAAVIRMEYELWEMTKRSESLESILQPICEQALSSPAVAVANGHLSDSQLRDCRDFISRALQGSLADTAEKVRQ